MNERAMQRLHKRRRAARRRRFRRFTTGWVVAALIGLSVLALLADRLMDPAAFTISEIRFEGEFGHLDPEDLNAVVTQAVQDNYFAMDLGLIEAAAETLEWVKSARVRRVWPNTLHVSVKEHELVARWGESGWLGTSGEVLTIADANPGELIHLDGPPGSAPLVLGTSRRWSPLLSDIGLTLSALQLDERRAWRLWVSPQASEGAFEVVLGVTNTSQRLNRFITAFRSIPEGQLSRISRIDARYPNGLAVEYAESDGQERDTA